MSKISQPHHKYVLNYQKKRNRRGIVMVDNKRCILIVDDEVRMVRGLKDFLMANQFHILEAYDGEEALSVYYNYSSQIDLILLDVMMPKYDGFEVLADLRDNGSMVPVVMLTARGEEYDQLQGFRQGADDYMTKPFSPSLLLAHIESILRRMGKDEVTEIAEVGIKLNPVKRFCSADGKRLELTKREFDLLYFLILNKGLTFTREQILNSVWGYEFEGNIRTVDTHVKQLRVKLRGKAGYIQTVHKVGYRFEVLDENFD